MTLSRRRGGTASPALLGVYRDPRAAGRGDVPVHSPFADAELSRDLGGGQRPPCLGQQHQGH